MIKNLFDVFNFYLMAVITLKMSGFKKYAKFFLLFFCTFFLIVSEPYYGVVQ